jgi:serine/threonine protein kinase
MKRRYDDSSTAAQPPLGGRDEVRKRARLAKVQPDITPTSIVLRPTAYGGVDLNVYRCVDPTLVLPAGRTTAQVDSKAGGFVHTIYKRIQTLKTPIGFAADTGAGIVLKSTIGAGSYGRIFLGSFPGIPNDVVIKVQVDHIAVPTFAGGGGLNVDDPKKLNEAVTEYQLMRDIPCRPEMGMEAPIVCVYGAAALVIGGFAFFAIAVEKMDGDVDSYLRAVLTKYGQDEDTCMSIGAVIILKALRTLRVLHSYGYMHIDAHAGNWLVNFKGGRLVCNMDLRLSDLGLSCTFNPANHKDKGPPGSVDSCLQKAELEQRRADPFLPYTNFDTWEYTQFLSFVVTVMKALFGNPEIAPISAEMKRAYWMILQTQVYLQNMLHQSKPIEMIKFKQIATYDDYISHSKLEVIMYDYVHMVIGKKKSTVFTRECVAKLIREGVLPSNI